jgi:hypothetical protein
MRRVIWTIGAWFLPAVLFALCAGSAAMAQDLSWRISKASGDVWVATSGAQPVALTSDAVLKAGDTIRTGQNGRVLLARGGETILVSANSVVGIPADRQNGMTTIAQQAGSILLEIEKRNVPHFEVATPYLAAVVKGTQFRVTVNASGSSVDVLRGQVQVVDYKTGQNALVNPGQAAVVAAQGTSGLSLSGSGILSPIQQGTPRSPIVTPATPSEPVQRRAQATEPERPAQRISSPSSSSSSDSRSGDSGWFADLVAWGKGVLGLNGGKGRNDTVPLVLAVPAVIGLSVEVGAGVLRRRKKEKPGGK